MATWANRQWEAGVTQKGLRRRSPPLLEKVPPIFAVPVAGLILPPLEPRREGLPEFGLVPSPGSGPRKERRYVQCGPRKPRPMTSRMPSARIAITPGRASKDFCHFSFQITTEAPNVRKSSGAPRCPCTAQSYRSSRRMERAVAEKGRPDGRLEVDTGVVSHEPHHNTLAGAVIGVLRRAHPVDSDSCLGHSNPEHICTAPILDFRGRPGRRRDRRSGWHLLVGDVPGVRSPGKPR